MKKNKNPKKIEGPAVTCDTWNSHAIEGPAITRNTTPIALCNY